MISSNEVEAEIIYKYMFSDPGRYYDGKDKQMQGGRDSSFGNKLSFESFHAFFKKQDLSTICTLSTRPSTSSGFDVRRIFFTMVPLFSTAEDPFTLRSLIRCTESPSRRIVPLLSFTSMKIFVSQQRYSSS